MNRDQLEGQWEQLKGKAREYWGKLTDDDLEQVKGCSQQLAGRIQEKYGVTKEEAERQINDFCQCC